MTGVQTCALPNWKLREAMQAAHIHGDDAWHATNLAKALLARLDPLAVDGWSLPELAMSLPLDPEGARLLGLNLWDGVTWFNAEAFKTAATFTAGASLVWSAAKGIEKTGNEKAVLTALEQVLLVAEASGWDYGRFVELLQPPAGKTQAGKNLATKPPADKSAPGKPKPAATDKGPAKPAKSLKPKDKK